MTGTSRLTKHSSSRRAGAGSAAPLRGLLRLTPACAALLLLSSPRAQAQITVDQPIPPVATIQVNAGDVTGKPLPPTVFGTFLEPIGNSTYNGLWAELLQNPSLESGLWSAGNVQKMLHDDPQLVHASELGIPLPWKPLNPQQGNRYLLQYGHAANTWQSLTLLGLPDQPVGILQTVYLPVQRTLQYKASLYARHIAGQSAVTIALRLHDRPEVLVSAQIQATSGQWTKYSVSLTVPAGKLHRLDPADFVVQVNGDANIQLDELSLMPADALDGLDPDVVAMAKAMHTPLLRFGGNFTSAYNWRDGIGPRDQRISMRNIAWGIPEYNTFGTDELLHFCSLIGAQPQIAINMGSGTPEQAAAWVRYVDQHWRQHSGLLWELGNELWGDWNLGYPTRSQLAARTLAFSKAIRAVDPSARLIATGGDPDWFNSWNAIQLTNPPGTFNYLSAHFVVTNTQTQQSHPSAPFVTAAAFALPIELGRKLQQDQAQINQTPGYADKAHVAFTEWLFVGQRPGTPNFTNMGGAIDTAGFLNMIMRHAAIVPVSDMTGIMDFAGIWKDRSQVYGAPGYWAFRMYATAHATLPVQVQAQSGEYSVQHGVTRLPDIAKVPYLDVFAALTPSRDRLVLFCVNRSLSTDIPANIRIQGFTAAGDAAVQTLRSHSISDVNDADEPNRVTPVQTEEKTEGDHLRHIFPYESVTVLTFRRSG